MTPEEIKERAHPKKLGQVGISPQESAIARVRSNMDGLSEESRKFYQSLLYYYDNMGFLSEGQWKHINKRAEQVE